MQNNIISKMKILVFVLLLIASNRMLFAQGGDSIRGKGLYLGLSLEPSQSLITNNGDASVAGIFSEKAITYGGSVEFGYFFTRHLGLSTGIGYSSYGSKLSLGAYQNFVGPENEANEGYESVDSENEEYDLLVSGKNIEEEQILNYFHVPVYLNLRLPFSKTIGLFVQSGIDLSFALNQSYKSSGTFTYKGYYSAYNVLLENLPTYGFPSNKATNVEGTLEVQPFTVFAVATAGFDFFLSDQIQLAVAATYRKSLSDISAYAANSQYQLSPGVGKINSFMDGSTSVSAESLGITVKLRYFLK
jgi:hypothetical protein